MKCSIISCLLLFVCWVNSAQATDTLYNDKQRVSLNAELTNEQLWDAANTAYINENYTQAIEGYEMILSRSEHSAKLYYNLANALFKDGDLGAAILNYNRALRLSPGDDDIRYNLHTIVEAKTKDKIEAIPQFFALVWLSSLRDMISGAAWVAISLLALVVALLALLLYLLSSTLNLRKAGFYTSAAAILIFICTTWAAYSARERVLSEDEAIVMVSSTAVKSSPDGSATELFILHEGTKLTITEHLDEWVEVVIADGKKGWLESKTIEVI